MSTTREEREALARRISNVIPDATNDNDVLDEAAQVLREPIDLVLFCPCCGTQHIDAPKPCDAENCASGCALMGDCLAWCNPPHRSHKCISCGHVWRPADVCTNGVLAVTTRGRNDSPVINQHTVRRLSRTVSMTEEEAHFLAVRLRRLCERLDYQLPAFAADDARCVEIASTVLGVLLSNLGPKE